MRIYRKISIAGLIGLIIFVSGCATYRVHPEFKERHKSIRSVAVMPSEVEVYKLTFKGDKELMFDLLPVVEANSRDELEKIFQKKKYLVKKLDLSDAVLEEAPELRTALFSVKQLFKKSLDDIAKRKKKKFTYTLGPEVNQFADLADSDILAFVSEVGYKKTGGEIVKDVVKSILIGAVAGFVPVAHFSETVIQLAIVDSNDGDILWYNHNIGKSGIDAASEKQLRGTIRNLLRPFPKCAAVAPVPEEAVAPVPEEEVTKKGIPEMEAKRRILTEEELLETYRKVVKSSIAKRIVFPKGAEEGVVYLNVVVLPDGSLKSAEVIDEKCSGDTSLREAAIQGVKQAAPFSRFPDGITLPEVEVKFQITFKPSN